MKMLNLKRKETRNLDFIQEQAYYESLRTSKEKKKYLLDLPPIILDIYHDFNKNLKNNQSKDP